ncbi:MAG: ABC transporter substrate-binding protein [Roseiarcus sp.]
MDTLANRALKAQVAARFGADRRVSSYFATSYATVRLCVEAVTRCGTDDPVNVRAALDGLEIASPLGPLRIDRATNMPISPFCSGGYRAATSSSFSRGRPPWRTPT